MSENPIITELTPEQQALIPGYGSIHFWKKHNSCTPKKLLCGCSKKVYPPKVDAPQVIGRNGEKLRFQPRELMRRKQRKQ